MGTTDIEKAQKFLLRHGGCEGCYIVNYSKTREITYIYKWCRTKLLALEWIKKQGALVTAYSILADTPISLRAAKLSRHIEIDKDLK